MILPSLYQRLFRNDEPGSDGADPVDRGDDWTPPEGDETPPSGVEKKGEGAKDEAPAPEDEADVDPDNPDDDSEQREEKKPPKKDSRIPLSRHKEILERERAERAALEQRLKAFEGQKEVVKTNEQLTVLEDQVLAKEKEYLKALADGEVDKAATLMREIRNTERQIAETKSEQRAQAATAQAVEQARYDITLERLEEAYPQINPDHDEFDKATLQDVAEWAAFNQTQRAMTPAKALQAAVKKVLGAETRRQEAAVETTARVDKEEAAKKAAAERKKGAVEKALDTQKRTPPPTDKVGLDHDKSGGSLTAKDIMKLSPEEFAKLGDDVLARMRGDEIA